MQIKQILLEASAHLRAKGLPTPSQDAERLLAFVLQKDRQYLLLNPTQFVSPSSFQPLLQRRLKGEPLEYILGFAEFFGHRFEVTPDVLIPRMETEFLVQEVLNLTADNLRVCDIGTGSGAIAASLKLARPSWEVYASDISRPALSVAARNFAALGANIILRQSSLLDDLGEAFDVIVTNPPYLPNTPSAVQPSVWQYEPHLALFAEEDGLALYRQLFSQIAQTQKQLKFLFCEIGHDQGAPLLALAKDLLSPHLATLQKDLAGFDRILKIEFNDGIL